MPAREIQSYGLAGGHKARPYAILLLDKGFSLVHASQSTICRNELHFDLQPCRLISTPNVGAGFMPALGAACCSFGKYI